MQRIKDEYVLGVNRFNKQGEVLFFAMIDNEITGNGGLNQDPYMNHRDYGRVRHVYVRKKYRRNGVGKAI